MECLLRWFGASWLVLAGGGWSLAEGPGLDSPVYWNVARAVGVVDEALEVHRQESDVRLEYEGARWYKDHSYTATTRTRYAVTGSLCYSSRRGCGFLEERAAADARDAMAMSLFVAPDRVVLRDHGESEAKTGTQADPARRLDLLSMLPAEVLRLARSRAASLRVQQQTQGHDIVSFALENGETVSLFVEIETHRLARIEQIISQEYRGDFLERIDYDDYRQVAGRWVPGIIRSFRFRRGDDGRPRTPTWESALTLSASTKQKPLDRAELEQAARRLGAGDDWRLADVAAVTSEDAASSKSAPSSTVPSNTVPSTTVPSTTVPSNTVPSSTVPSGSAPSSTAPSGAAPSISAPAVGLEIVAVGRDASMIILPEQDCKVTFIEFDEYVIVVEAPLLSTVGERILAAVDQATGGKPIRYLIMSHHHLHYSGGLRPFVQRGVQLVSGPGDAAYYRSFATWPRRLRPDAQQLQPREPRFLIVDDVHVFEDVSHRVEVHNIHRESMHTDDYLVTYLPADRLLLEGDLAYIAEDRPPRPASDRAASFHRAIMARQLDVERYLQTWPLRGQRHLNSWADLTHRVELRDR